MEKLSIIVPCFNEEKVLNLFYNEIIEVKKQLKNKKMEIIFVDDGSNDSTLDLIKNISLKDKQVRFLSFTKNFGKEAAMLAGLEYSTGDYVVVMDADLQDPPSLLPEMLAIVENENFDSVGTRRVTRKGEPLIRSLFARTFYKLINKVSKVKMVDGARDYRLMTRQMVNVILSMKERNRYSKGLWNFPGFKTKWLEYENIERVAGETKWSFLNLCCYAFECITSFTTFPLVLSIIIGIIINMISLALLIIGLFINNNISITIISMILMMGSLQLIFIGVLGGYFSKLYIEMKNRPIYIIKENEKGIYKLENTENNI